MVKINGKDIEADGRTLLDYLDGADYDPECIAVEINGDIVPKKDYVSTILRDGDCVEIVSFVGGG